MYTVSEREDYFQHAVTKVQAIKDVEGIIHIEHAALRVTELFKSSIKKNAIFDYDERLFKIAEI